MKLKCRKSPEIDVLFFDFLKKLLNTLFISPITLQYASFYAIVHEKRQEIQKGEINYVFNFYINS